MFPCLVYAATHKGPDGGCASCLDHLDSLVSRPGVSSPSRSSQRRFASTPSLLLEVFEMSLRPLTHGLGVVFLLAAAAGCGSQDEPTVIQLVGEQGQQI